MPARRKSGFTLIELLVVIAIIAILAAILFPVFARARKAAQASTCQSNLKQIGKSIKLYLADWQDTFMTNRPYSGGDTTVLAGINDCVALSPPVVDTSTNEVKKFVYGITWVEGLYSYIEQVSKGDSLSVWKCPSSSSATYPLDPAYNCNTHYVFNRSLIEKTEGICKSQSNLLMCREFGRMTASTLRPTNDMTGNPGGDSNDKPQYAFLNNGDVDGKTITQRYCKPHGNGSHILFADGHVQFFDIGFYPECNSKYRTGTAWEGAPAMQWYNYNNSSSIPKEKRLTIAVTP